MGFQFRSRVLVRLCCGMAAAFVGLSLSAMPATADCIQSGQTVTCSGPDTVGGFDAGAQNNLTVNVQPLATVNDNGAAAAAIILNDTNTVTNNGTVTTANPGVNGIDFLDFNVVTNNATISVGIGGSALSGFDNNVIVNNGAITAGATGTGIFTGLNNTITNAATGVITVGDDGAGIYVAGNGVVTNAGAIALGDASAPAGGIFADGDFNKLVNAATGTITGRDGMAGMVVQGNDATVTNAGSITLRDSALGILVQGDNAVIRNTGTIVARDNSVGIAVTGDSNTVVNSGTITVRDGIFSTGIESNSIFGSNHIVNTGTINVGANATGIFLDGYGTVFNSGTINAATGAAAIEFCSCGLNYALTLGPGSAINGLVVGNGIATLQLGGSGKDTFDLGLIGVQYVNFGNFSKVHDSTWTVVGTGAQDWNVLGGTLLVNGAINGIVFVENGATLGGTGTVGVTFLTSGAALAPGLPNALGTLTVNDQLLFCNCTFYDVKVTSGGSDLTQVVAGGYAAGMAGLGGTVRVASLDNTYRFNSPYNILTAAGGFDLGSGATRFDNLVTPTGINGVLGYTATDVNLTLVSALGQLSGLSINQRNVANLLDGAFNTAGISGALGAIFNGNVPLNLTQASGELATSSQQSTFDAMNLFLSVMTDPFVTGRGFGAAGNAGATPFADDGGAHAYAAKKQGAARDALARFATKADVARNDLMDPRWSVWGSAYGGGSNTSGNATLGSQSATARAFGFAAGVDYRISPDTLAGFSLAGGGTNFGVSGFGTGRSDLFQAGAFVRKNFGATYVTAAAAYGWQAVTTDRTVTVFGVDRLRAEFTANAWSGRVEAGHRFATPWMGITPYAAGQFTTYGMPAYAEQVVSGAGTFALNYAARDVTASRTELGVRADKSFAMPNGILTLRGRAAWAHDFNTDRNVTALFQTLPGASFVVNGAAQAHDSALLTGAAEMKWLNGWSAAAVFEGQFSNVTTSYAGKGIARYFW